MSLMERKEPLWQPNTRSFTWFEQLLQLIRFAFTIYKFLQMGQETITGRNGCLYASKKSQKHHQRRRNMKKVACAVLVLTMIIFLVNPLSSNASGGHSSSNHSSGGHHSNGGYHSSGGYHWSGGYWGWWAPWAVYGGAAVLTPYYYPYYPYYYPYYYSHYYASPIVVVGQEKDSVIVQSAPSVSPSTDVRIFIYPRKGQNKELQEKDRYECHRWGVSQTDYDPTQPNTGMRQAQLNQIRADYKRAMSACLDSRGYTMK
jgi:hypothetical protein